MIAELEAIEVVEPRIDDGFFYRLHDYQIETDEMVRRELRAGKKNVMICSPTGSGKAVMGTHKIWQCYHKGMRAVFVVPRITLIDQISRDFDLCGIPHGVVQANHWRSKPGERIQICSADTLTHRGWPKADLIIIDEAHLMKKTIANRISQRNCVTLGMSATPLTSGLGKLYDAVVTVTTHDKLVEAGKLAKFMAYAPSAPDMSQCAVNKFGEWSEEDCSKGAMTITGDAVEHYKKLGRGGKFIGFGAMVVDCEKFHRDFARAGIQTALFTHLTPAEERREIMEEFRKPDSYIRGLISVSALSEGLDVTDIEVIIMCKPIRRSLMRFIQEMGRAARMHECKAEKGFVVLDHAGNLERLGGELLDFYENSIHELDDGKTKKSATAAAKEKKLVKCPKCFHVFKGGPSCPACGHVFAPKLSVVEIEPGELKEWRGNSVNREDKVKLFGELKSICAARGYKPGWAAMKFKEFVGIWPDLYKSAQPIEPSPETLERVRKSAAAFFARSKSKSLNHV